MQEQSNNDENIELVRKFRDLLALAIHCYAKDNPQINLDAPVAQENLATFIAAYMMPTLEGYEDEINSLRFMLDELENSQAALRSPEFHEELRSSIDEHMVMLKLMQRNRGDA